MERIIEWLKDEHIKHPNAKIDIYVGSDMETSELDIAELSLEDAIERLKKIEKIYELNMSDFDMYDDYYVSTYQCGDCICNDIEDFLYQCDAIEYGEEITYIWIKG